MNPIDWEALGQNILALAEGNLAQFVKDNAAQAQKLGTDKVKAILQAELLNQVITVSAAPEGASLKVLADNAELLAKRDNYSALVAQAELVDAQATADLKKKAIETATKILTAAGGAAVVTIKSGIFG